MEIRIFPDGKVQGTINGVKGKRCTDYIGLIEQMMGSRVFESHYTPEFYEDAEVYVRSTQTEDEDEDLTIGVHRYDL